MGGASRGDVIGLVGDGAGSDVDHGANYQQADLGERERERRDQVWGNVGQILSNWEKSGTFSDQISVHFLCFLFVFNYIIKQ